jgi:hypothetical protein
MKKATDKAAIIIDLSNYGLAFFTIQRNSKNKVYVLEVERLT